MLHQFPYIPVFTEKSNPTALVDGVSVDAVPLANSPVQYSAATIVALKPGATALHKPTANAGTVYICGGPEKLTGAFPVVPGADIQLMNGGDLADYYLAVDNAGDGVSICYT